MTSVPQDQSALESDQPALESVSQDQSALEDVWLKYQKELETESSLSIMVLGEPGIGKSTLINGFLGEEVADTGIPGFIYTKGITTKVRFYELKKKNATIKIWDSPGLLDSTCDTDDILSKVVDIFHEIDLFLFCIDMASTRYLPNIIVKQLIRKINSVVHGDIWKKTLFTLVKANVAISAIECRCKSKEAIKVAFANLVSGYHTDLTKDLKEFSDDDLHLIPVGHYNDPKLLEDDTKHWLSAFWEKCFERISSPRGKSALVKATLHRLKLSTEEDHTYDSHPLQLRSMLSSWWYGKDGEKEKYVRTSEKGITAQRKTVKVKDRARFTETTERDDREHRERVIKNLETKLTEAEERARNAETTLKDARKQIEQRDRRIQELERALESERKIKTLSHRLEAAEPRKTLAESTAGEINRQWLVKRTDIHLTEERIGGGGWGEVKVAEFRGSRVAAKSLYPAIRSGTFYQRVFVREMDMASRVRHPNLVQFIGACVDGGMIILMELMPTSLRKELENDSHLTVKQHISISLDMARALNYLHLMKPESIIHRDISSANVLLEHLSFQHMRAKLTDYGSVNIHSQLNTENPGSPVYSAPEACIPSLQSPKMDIFSFGVLLVEMCTAQFPEVSDREDMIGSIKDQQWVELIQRCTNPDKDRRPSAAELIALLKSW